MRASLAIYVLLMLLAGVVTWQATGSPLLLALPVAGVMLYGVLCIRPGAMAEVGRLLFSVIMVALEIFHFGMNVSAIFVGLLTMAIYLAATQAVWEIMHAQTERDKSAPKVRLSVFSMAFYASCGIAYVLLREGEDLRLSELHRILMALLFVLLSVAAWDLSRVLRLKKAEGKASLGAGQLLTRIAAGLAVAVIFGVIFAGVLPPLADALCKFSPHLGRPKLPGSDLGPPRRPSDKGTPKPAEPSGAGGANASVGGPDVAAMGGEAKLPDRGTLRPNDEARLFLQFDNPEEGKFLSSKGALFVRNLALGNYADGTWTAKSDQGHWRTDAQDGKQDGQVTLTPPGRESIRHKIFLPESDYYTAPALVGVQEYGVPKLYVLTDDWHQVESIGNLKYFARSQPRIWGQLHNEQPLRASVMSGYLYVPDGPLGEVLQRLSQEVFKGKHNPEEAVPLLEGFMARHYEYSLKIENKNNLPALENFLLDEKKGYCDFFSTASALLLRKAGIPTRVAYGYAGGAFDNVAGVYVFRQKDAHSWTEIHLEGYGWVSCDFTPAVAGEEQQPQASGIAGLNLAGFDDVGEEKKEETKVEKKKEESAFAQLRNFFPKIGPALMVAIGMGIVLAVGLWMYYQRRKQASTEEAKRRRAAAARDRQPAYFLEFVKMAGEFGFLRHPGDTLRELQSAMKKKEIYHPGFDRMAVYHYQVRYEDAPVERERESEWMKLIHHFRRERKGA